MMVSKRQRNQIQPYLFVFLLSTVFELSRHPVICHFILLLPFSSFIFLCACWPAGAYVIVRSRPKSVTYTHLPFRAVQLPCATSHPL